MFYKKGDLSRFSFIWSTYFEYINCVQLCITDINNYFQTILCTPCYLIFKFYLYG